MTPKSGEDAKASFSDFLQKFDGSVEGFTGRSKDEFSKIADLFNIPLDELSIATEMDDSYYLLDELITQYTELDDLVKIKVEDTDDELGGIWFCYPKMKVANWASNNIRAGIMAWVYSKKFLEEKIEKLKIK